MRNTVFGGISAAAILGVAAFGVVALADSVGPFDFESPTYSIGTVNGQDGWMKTGPFDVEVGSSLGTPGFGAQSLRISNAITSGSFGDQTFSPSTANEAGETASVSGGYSGGTRQNHFEAQFDIASTMSGVQPGLFMSVSPDRGDGARMSYLSFADGPGGIDVTFYDVANPGPLGTVASFNPTDLGLISRDPHTIKFVIDFVDGPANDVVKIYIDGALVHTGTTWEDYYRFDPEQNGGGNLVPTTDSLIFRVSGTAAPATLGNGYLVDNVSLMTGTPAPVALTGAQCKNSGWMNVTDDQGKNFKNQGDCVSFIATKGKNKGAGN